MGTTPRLPEHAQGWNTLQFSTRMSPRVTGAPLGNLMELFIGVLESSSVVSGASADGGAAKHDGPGHGARDTGHGRRS